MTINDSGYELNAATSGDAQVKFLRNPNKITHTRNVDTHQKLLISQTIGIFHEYISVFLPSKEPSIGVNKKSTLLISAGVVQATQVLQLPAVQEIVSYTALVRTEPNRTLQRVRSTGVDRTTLYLSGICGTSASPHSGGLLIPGVFNKQ